MYIVEDIHEADFHANLDFHDRDYSSIIVWEGYMQKHLNMISEKIHSQLDLCFFKNFMSIKDK